jgi:hypothetical protein
VSYFRRRTGVTDAGNVHFEEILALTKHLSPTEKLRLIEQVLPDLEGALSPAGFPERGGLRGGLKGYQFSEEDIARVRQEMWGRFEGHGS